MEGPAAVCRPSPNSFFASHGGSPIFRFHTISAITFTPPSRGGARLQPALYRCCSSSLTARPVILLHRVQL